MTYASRLDNRAFATANGLNTNFYTYLRPVLEPQDKAPVPSPEKTIPDKKPVEKKTEAENADPSLFGECDCLGDHILCEAETTAPAIQQPVSKKESSDEEETRCLAIEHDEFKYGIPYSASQTIVTQPRVSRAEKPAEVVDKGPAQSQDLKQVNKGPSAPKSQSTPRGKEY